MSEDRQSQNRCFPPSPAVYLDDPDVYATYTYQPPVPFEFELCPFSDEPLSFYNFTSTMFPGDDFDPENPFVKPSYFTTHPPSLQVLPDLPSEPNSDSESPSKLHDSTTRRKAIAKARMTPGNSPTKIKVRGCGCQTSNCLRRYCKCFSNRGYCYEGCGCVDCFNTPEYEKERQLVIQKTEEICKTSFEPKIRTTDTGIKINAEGCRCKSGCKSKHCLCSKNGVGCSPICRCKACENAKVELEPAEVRKYFRVPLRTKERILISSDALATGGEKLEVSSPQPGKKTTVVFFPKADTETRISHYPSNSMTS